MPPYLPSPLAAYAARLDARQPVLFVEHLPTNAGPTLFAALRANCAIVMVASALLVVGHAAGAIYLAATDDPSFALMILVCGLPWLFFGLVAKVLSVAFGRMQRRAQGPDARLLEVSRDGLRLSEQSGPIAWDGPRVDAHGRALLPWTPWGEVLGGSIDGDTLSLTLRDAPGRVDLRLVPEVSREAHALVGALWVEAHRPRG